MPNPFGRWSLPNLIFHHGAPIQQQNRDSALGRYSLPSVMGRLFHHGQDNGGNTGIVPPDPSNYPISQVGGLNSGGFTGSNDYNPSGPFTNPSIGGDNPSLPPVPANGDWNPGGNTGGGMSDPFGGGFLGGMTGGTSHPGGQWGGTLGGGSAVDPSQWGQFGAGGAGAGNSGDFYRSQMGNANDGGGIAGQGRGLIGTGFFLNRQAQHQTGGALPPQGYDSSGINPGGMYTGGNLPAQGGMTTGGNLPANQGGMTTGGNYPAQASAGWLSRLGGRQPPGGLMR